MPEHDTTPDELAGLYDAVRGKAKLLGYVRQGTLIATNPEGHCVDAITPERAAFLCALVNAYASGDLVPAPRASSLPSEDANVMYVECDPAPTPVSDKAREEALNRAAFDEVLGFLYNSQHTDLGISKETALRAGTYAAAALSTLEATE